MIYSIENENLKISVNTKGAELYSLYSKKTNVEYLWQGDKKFWEDRAPNLFPFVGRNYDDRYRYDGKEYVIRFHGLAPYMEFDLEKRTENELIFLLKDDEKTHKAYPFAFEFRVIFTLEKSSLTTRYEVTNVDKRTLICAFGGHPGFNVPFGKGAFEDYSVVFSSPTQLRRILLVDGTPYLADASVDYPLEDGVKINLRHDLFINDAIILENTSGEVFVKSDKEPRYLSMKFSDFPFLGVWQEYIEGAPFLCLEPWSALPPVNGAAVDLEVKPNMTHVPAGRKAEKSFTLTVHE